jgi:hypothetical protein
MATPPPRTLFAVLKRLDASQTTVFVRYTLNRVIDVFVIGPATVMLFLALGAWAAGVSPFRMFAEGYAEAGEAFRGAPSGLVALPALPAPSREHPVPLPLRPDELAKLPKRLVSVEDYVITQTDGFFATYVAGVFLGLIVLVIFRGSLLLIPPTHPAPRQSL